MWFVRNGCFTRTILSKTYTRFVLFYEKFRLELYGGKINVLAVELHQWLASLWRGKALAYTLAVLTLMLSALLWFIGSRAASLRETQAATPQTPSDAWS